MSRTQLPDCCHALPKNKIPHQLRALKREGWIVATCDHVPGSFKFIHESLPIQVFKCKHCPNFHVHDGNNPDPWCGSGSESTSLEEALVSARAHVTHANELGPFQPLPEHPFYPHLQGCEWVGAATHLLGALKTDILFHVSGLAYIRMKPSGFEVFNIYLLRDKEAVTYPTLDEAVTAARAYLAKIKGGLKEVPQNIEDFIKEETLKSTASVWGYSYKGQIVAQDIFNTTMEFVVASKLASLDDAETLRSCFADGFQRHLASVDDPWTGSMFDEERHYRLIEIDDPAQPWAP